MKKSLKISYNRSSKIFTLISILTTLLKCTNGVVNQVMFLKSDCSTKENNFSKIYNNNINILLSNLESKSNTKKFYNCTSVENTNKIYGLFICNTLFVDQVCHDCVTSAATQIGLSCPSSVEAIVWYSSCMLRYSNRDIFTNNDVSVYYNILVGPKKYSQFSQRLSESLISLIGIAAKGNSSSTPYMTSVYVSSEIVTVCYVECTPDIGPLGCSQCLQTALGRLEFDGSQSGIVLQLSCRLTYYFSDSRSDSQGKKRYASVGVIVAIAIASVAMNVYVSLEKRKIIASPTGLNELESMEHLRFNFAAIREATDNFSEANKLGQGGFGVVYLGTLSNEKTVAVKRLSNASSQGIKAFKDEACLTARLQHRNLVKLFGFCLEKQEMLLVYEYMPNKSLDRLLFDPKRRANLKWKTRYKIIIGLARGLLYLHEDSEPQIIHRDIKPSNILLDEDMNPRIADFGIARSFDVDQTQDDTSRVAGTRGYMAPEYVSNGSYSIKADIFSFGVILLEILSGQRNYSSNSDVQAENLLSFAWGRWKEDDHLKLVDTALQDDFSKVEVERCIHIGLLCVQKDPIKRPRISSILLMLNT
ncbi:hypothetical protein RND81_06G126700 [Saponaria officinalis]|uniref:Cysteine-rich receptor-like protein kinase 10 n=1 Tax=Saponaria officinalis TaxID=3572 RepID=A0AAW1K5E4_SAPOF